MDQREKSLQELENDYWPDQSEYPSQLVERCHGYRKIILKELQIHQIITLLIQGIGSEFLLPIALEKMQNDIAEEDKYDGSSFIVSLDLFNDEIFKSNPVLHRATLDLLNQKRTEIENLVGWKRYERIKRKIEAINN